MMPKTPKLSRLSEPLTEYLEEYQEKLKEEDQNDAHINPKDEIIILKMLEDVTIMKWDYSGNFLRLTKGKAYRLPREVALSLQRQGYCWFTEKV